MSSNPGIALLGWSTMRNQLLVLLLIIGVIFSALAVSYTAFTTRQMYAELQQLTNEADKFGSEYQKLLLEQSAWADFSKVDQVAREELHMRVPDGRQRIMVEW